MKLYGKVLLMGTVQVILILVLAYLTGFVASTMLAGTALYWGLLAYYK